MDSQNQMQEYLVMNYTVHLSYSHSHKVMPVVLLQISGQMILHAEEPKEDYMIVSTQLQEPIIVM